jgi:hypothetical protein
MTTEYFKLTSDVNATLAWARAKVCALGVDADLMTRNGPEFSETDLLRELAWVILCSGFREKVIRRLFPKISLCFFDWSSCEAISRNSHICVTTALDLFKSKPKITAIADSASLVHEYGFDILTADIMQNPVQTLQKFPFIGPVTAFHLAKNLGFDLAKPDRHLLRLSIRHGYTDVHEFCSRVAKATGESIRTIDTLFWRVSEMGLGDEIYMPSMTKRSQGSIFAS